MVIAPLRQSIVSSIGVVRALTSERAASASVSGSLGRILCEDAAQSPTWATLASRAGGYQHQSHRSLVSVDVHGNKVDRALRQLRRKLIDEGVRETWLKQRVFVKVGLNQNLNTSSFVPYRMGSFLPLLALALTLSRSRSLARRARSFAAESRAEKGAGGGRAAGAGGGVQREDAMDFEAEGQGVLMIRMMRFTTFIVSWMQVVDVTCPCRSLSRTLPRVGFFFRLLSIGACVCPVSARSWCRRRPVPRLPRVPS